MKYAFMQELENYLSDGSRISADIIHTEGEDAYYLEASLTTNELYKSRLSEITNHSSANEAFKQLLNLVIAYSNGKGLSLKCIDNPCNTPFINKNEEASVISGTNLKTELKVNGK